jgi:hypothetical protein
VNVDGSVGLAFIEWIQPVADAAILAELDGELEKLLTPSVELPAWYLPAKRQGLLSAQSLIAGPSPVRERFVSRPPSPTPPES